MSDFRKLIDLTNLYTRYTLLEATAEELAQALYDSGRGKVFGTDEAAIMKALDQIKSPEEFKSVSDAYKAISPRNTELTKDLQDEMSGNELEKLNNTLAKFNPAASGTVQQEPATPPAGNNPDDKKFVAADPNAGVTQPAGNNPDEADPNAGATPPAGNNPDEADPNAGATPPAGNNPDEADPNAGATPPAGNNPDEADPTGGVGGADAAAKAAAKPPVRPGQATSGLPAKLGQVTSKNLMKDYQTGGKKPMDQVKTIQLALSRLGFDPNGIDGKYGNGVFKAVQDFQKANGLTVDGQVGPNTIKAMQAKLNADAAPAAATGTAAPAAADAKVAQDPTGGVGGADAAATPTVAPGTGADGPAGGAKAPAAKAEVKPVVKPDKEVQIMPNGQTGNFNIDRSKPYIDKDGVRTYGDAQQLATKFPGEKPVSAPTQQNQSKDHSMKKAMNESASMNVSMTADTADQVAELMKLLKNAGMSDAAPVSSMMAPMPSMPPMGAAAPKQDSMADFIGMVGGDEMDGPSEPCSVCGEVHEETSCSEDTSEYDAVVAEWDNSPDEEYKDANYMLNDLAGGINRPKKAYAKAQDGDNAMAVEAIKSDLRKALEEALAKK
jgi:hypothetical protein